MTVIPLKQQIINRMKGDTTFTSYLGSGVYSIMPQAGLHPSQDSIAPFTVLKMGAETPTSAITARQFFQLFIYDDPFNGYWDIDRIIARSRSLFDGYEGLSFDGRLWGRAVYDGSSDEQVDDAWHKVFKVVIFNVPRV